ncbi:class I SAM-dependent methyltransferase [Sulfurovum sp.]|uniref:class I SAM-dependent methyltransferase n=1 Tax=Sulfurovum sp. TaxID=1969726 RepID=UPI0025F0BC17|nr:class I SAM-dependent methyltransferase [Sulfurovum sp.]
MPKTEAFEKFPQAYEAWFEKHSTLYNAEIEAIKKLLPAFKNGIEIGVGSGRFAVPLGIRTGVEPSTKMAEIARTKGINVIEGIAEDLPVKNETFDLALMVTTICFVDDPLLSLQNIYQILKPDGYVIIGFVDRKSELGKKYEKNRRNSRFYGEARFYDVNEVIGLLKKAGFSEIVCTQTLFGKDLEHMDTSVKKGYGEGAFIALRARKDHDDS